MMDCRLQIGQMQIAKWATELTVPYPGRFSFDSQFVFANLQ